MNYRRRGYRLTDAITLLFVCLVCATCLAQEEPRARKPIDIENRFSASGWMGDGTLGRKYIAFDGANETDPHSKPSCIKITYTFSPDPGWAGIYWQNKPDNWGKLPGDSYSSKKLAKVTFWVKGTTGKEVVEFKSGCTEDAKLKYHDSFCQTTGRIALSTKWEQRTIDLEGADLSSVIGGFCWVASKDFNKAKAITFYLDDIQFE